MIPLTTSKHRLSPVRRIPLLLLALVTAAFTLVEGVLAQEKGVGDPKRDAALDPTPLVIEAFHLRFNPPQGAKAVTDNLNAIYVVTLTDSGTTPTWNMRVQSMKSSLDNPSPTAQIDDLLKDLDKMNAEYKVLVNEARTISGLEARLCYLQRTNSEGKKFVSGWLVVPVAPVEFVVFAMQMVPETYSSMRGVFDACFATIDVKTHEEVLTTRNARLKNGHELLKSLTPERLKSLVGQKQWSRIYKPATAAGEPASEVGWAAIEVVADKRGAMSINRDQGRYTSADREEGLMVKLEGRYIIDLKRRLFYDSTAFYWLAWDQSDERWSVSGKQWQGEAERNESETGLRIPATTGAPQSMISVIKKTSSGEPVSHQWETPDVLLPQALGWVIARLMPRDITGPQDYGWYYYVGSSMQPKIYQRIDRWEPAGDGNFTLTTNLTPETPSYASTYAPDGSFIRRVHSDGSVTEPITLEELLRLWKSKGLPVKAEDQ